MDGETNSANFDHTGENNSGFRKMFSLAPVYRFAQLAIGETNARKILTDQILQVNEDERILDIGCGTADILDHLPLNVDYIGFDPSEAYVTAARSRFGHRAVFATAGIANADELAQRDRTLAMAIGVFHHLDDEGATNALQLASSVLVKDGRFVSIDPTIVAGQHMVGRFLAKQDRGQHVRSPERTAELVRGVFPDAKISVRHDLLRVPYSHVIVTTDCI
jgi:SAM-dependent methyltransferase